MSYNYTIKYKTFNQLLDEVLVDFKIYNLEGFIDPAQLIKVAKRVSYDLGLRIMMTKEVLLEVNKGNVRLPADFYVLNYSLVCDQVSVQEVVPQGTHIEESFIPKYQQMGPSIISTCTDGTVNCNTCGIPCNTCTCQKLPAACPPLADDQSYCVKPRLILNCKGDTYELVQIVKSQERTFKRLWPLKIIENAQSIACDCPNLYVKSPWNAWIKGDFLFTNLDTANIYMSYQGMLVNDDGELLVPDHDMINEYYEYALKQRILENMLFLGEDVSQKISLIEQRLRVARIAAKNIVNTPNFAEMKEMWWTNRKAQYGKYYNMFSSYPWNQTTPNNLEGQNRVY